MKQQIGVFLLVLSICLCACKPAKITETSSPSKNHMKKKPKSPNDPYIMSGPIVEKAFVDKRGKASERKEYYLRASIQDYFIKFCESKVGREELEAYLAQLRDDPIVGKVISAEVEVMEGNWDQCPGDPDEMQSRVGRYVILKKLR